MIRLRCSLPFILSMLLTSLTSQAATDRYFRDCDTCPQMAIVPAQTINLGTDDGRPREGPRYSFKLRHALAFSRTEVTFDQWAECVADDVCPVITRDNGWGRGNRPVIRTSYADATRYTGWLSKLTNQSYRLPSEQEWEVAARAGTNTRYPWGEQMEPGHAHCRHCDKSDVTRFMQAGGKDKGVHKTIPVATLQPNKYGLFDMFGNVWEWTSSCWHNAPKQSIGLNSRCQQRSVRGGSWYFFGVVAGSPGRAPQYANQGSYDIGIRLVRPMSDEEVKRPSVGGK